MAEAVVHIIDDDEAIRDSLTFLLDSAGLTPIAYDSAVDFLAQIDGAPKGCIVTDVRMPDMSGLDLIRKLKERGVACPVLVMTGHADVPLAVEAMKAGAVEFLEKPFDEETLLRAIRSALNRKPAVQGAADLAERNRLQSIFEGLSPRERDVLEGVIAGKMNKVIAFDLDISVRTVEVYRANMMKKTGARGLSELVQMVMAARA